MTAADSYGVREAWTSSTPAEIAYELLRFSGFCVVDSGLDPEALAALRRDFDAAAETYAARYAAHDLAALGEHQTIRVLPALAPSFFALIDCAPLRALLTLVFGDSVALTQVNGLINPPAGERYAQARWHRDLPYQHFVPSRPVAVNALFCLDEFTLENGATWVAVGSHKEEKFPSPAALEAIARPIAAPAGSFLVLDAMLFHKGGENATDRPRRAVNHVYAIPPIRQQIALETAFPEDAPPPAHLRRLLGFGGLERRTVDEWLESRRPKAGG